MEGIDPVRARVSSGGALGARSSRSATARERCHRLAEALVALLRGRRLVLAGAGLGLLILGISLLRAVSDLGDFLAYWEGLRGRRFLLALGMGAIVRLLGGRRGFLYLVGIPVVTGFLLCLPARGDLPWVELGPRGERIWWHGYGLAALKAAPLICLGDVLLGMLLRPLRALRPGDAASRRGA